MAAKKKPEPGMGHGDLLAHLDGIIGDDSARFSAIKNWLHTGCDILNWIIHPQGHGYPEGRVVELYGKNSSGKTMLALTAAKFCQQAGGCVFYIDTEPGLSKEWTTTLGVYTEKDRGNWWSDTPGVLEQTLTCIEGIVEARKECTTPTLIVLDSLCATGTLTALARNTMKDALPVGDIARLISGWLRNKGVTRAMKSSRITLMILNQTRDKIGVMFGDPETTGGGQAVPFAAWLRLRVSKGKDIIPPPPGKALGYYCKVKVIKNKLAKPHQECSFPVYWKFGIDNPLALITYIENEKILPASGAFITWNGTKITKRKLRDSMLADPVLYTEVRELVKSHLFKEG